MHEPMNMGLYDAIMDRAHRGMNDALDPVNRFAEGNTALAAGNLAHYRQQQQIQQQQQFAREQAATSHRNAMEMSDAEAKRQLRNFQEQEKMKVISQGASEGLFTADDVKKLQDQDYAAVSAMYSDRKQERGHTQAMAAWQTLTIQEKKMEDNEQAAFEHYQQISTRVPIGNPQLRQQALRTALASPEAAKLPSDVRKSLQQAANTPGADPSDAVQEAVDRMQQFWGSKGWSKTERYGNANAFMSAYTQALMPFATEMQKEEANAANERYKSALAERQKYEEGLAAHLNQYSMYMGKDLKPAQDYLASLGQIGGKLPDVNKAMAGVKGPGVAKNAGGAVAQPAPAEPQRVGNNPAATVFGAPPVQSDPSQPSVPPVSAGEAYNSGGVLGVVGNSIQNSGTAPGTVAGSLPTEGDYRNLGAGIGQLFGGAKEALVGPSDRQQMSPPILRNEAMVNAIKIGMEKRMTSSPNPSPTAATDDEIAKAHALADAVHGAPPGTSQKNYQLLLQNPRTAPLAVNGMNELIYRVRQQNGQGAANMATPSPTPTTYSGTGAPPISGGQSSEMPMMQ